MKKKKFKKKITKTLNSRNCGNNKTGEKNDSDTAKS